MAHISFAVDRRIAPRVTDDECDNPDFGDRRYVWMVLAEADGSELTMQLGAGLTTDAEVVAGTEPLIAALERLRDAARERIAGRGPREAAAA